MSIRTRVVPITMILLIFSLLSACAEKQPAGIPSTNTALPPTTTAIPPTETPVPPTETVAPPTDTPVPPTATPLPSTETPEPAEELPLPEPDMTLWTQMANMPTARIDAASSVIDGKIYVIGGLGAPGVSTAVEMYNPESDTWSSKAPMPTGRGSLATSVVDGKIYAVGGNMGPGLWGETSAAVEMYDPATDTWTVRASMPAPRDTLATAVLDGKIYALGGGEVKGTEQWETFRTVNIYDPTMDTWTEGPPMHRPNDGFSAVVIDNMIYVVGGAIPYVEMYDPSTETWTKLTGMPMSKNKASVVEMNGLIHVFGGIEGYSSSVHSTATVFSYDVARDSWTTVAPMPFDGAGFAGSMVDDTIYLAGGTSVETYTPRYPPPRSSLWAYTP